MKDNINNSSLNILIIGTGMYVCGRGMDGHGTILPAVYEWKRHGKNGDVYIAGSQVEGIKVIKEKVKELNGLFNFEVAPKYFPETNTSNPEAYKDAIREIPKPACVVIVVPDNLHRKIAGHAIENGLHPLVVKPLAPTVKEVFELVELPKLVNRQNFYHNGLFPKKTSEKRETSKKLL